MYLHVYVRICMYLNVSDRIVVFPCICMYFCVFAYILINVLLSEGAVSK
jgi:hypothetical protein